MVKFRYLFVLIMMLGACTVEENDQVARPYAYHRIDFPERRYSDFESDCPFTFEVASHAIVVRPVGAANACWLNVEYPQLNAKIHLTYAQFDDKDGLGSYINDTHRMTYKHSVKASSIEEIPINKPANKVHGLYFKVGGNAASSTQFYITDSTGHFLRGAVYFESESRADSLEPLIAYIRADVEHLLETFLWK